MSTIYSSIFISTFIKANFEFLPRAITFLEKRGTKLSDSLKVIEDTKHKISHLKCTNCK